MFSLDGVELSFFLCEGTMMAYELLGPGSVSNRSAHHGICMKRTHTKVHTIYSNTNHITPHQPRTTNPTDLQLYATLNPPIAAASQYVCAPANRTTRTVRAPRSDACPGFPADGERLEQRTRPAGPAAPLLSPVATLQQRIRHRVRAPGAPAVAAGTPGDGSNRSRSNAKRCGAEAFQ